MDFDRTGMVLDSPAGWREAVRQILGIAVLGALVAVGTTKVPSLGAAPTRLAPDTARTDPPLHFQNNTFFETHYLARAANAAMDHYRGEAVDAPAVRADLKPEAAADEPQKKAETLARRYGVARELAQKIVDMALAEGIDPELGFRMIRVESGFKATARGARGAAGLLQLMPSTARTVDREVDTRKELLDPATNLRIGFRYLHQMIERYDGDVRLGVLAYNRGEIAVDRALRSGRDPENGYSHKVLGTKGKSPYEGKGIVRRVPRNEIEKTEGQITKK
jgi:soluble lytic murein transglycosylase-like protein